MKADCRKIKLEYWRIILKNYPKLYQNLVLIINTFLKFDKGVLNTKNQFKECEIMFVCRKCGKEVEEEVSHEYHIEHRRGKISSDKICSECN